MNARLMINQHSLIMNTKRLVKEINIDDEKVSLILNEQIPVVEWNGQEFLYLWFFLRAVPSLSDPLYIEEFCEISNFFWKGVQFQRITSILEYQQEYIQRVKLENEHSADVFPYRLTDYKIFDVSVMHPPKIVDEQLLYYVYNVNNGLPYRVVCPFPYPTTSTKVHYQILPILE